MLKHILALSLMAALAMPAFAQATTSASPAKATVKAHQQTKAKKAHAKAKAKPGAASKAAAAAAAVPAAAGVAESVSSEKTEKLEESPKASADVPFHGAWQGRFTGDSLGNIKVEVTKDGLAKVNCVVDESHTEFNLSGPVDNASGAVSAIEKSFGPSGIKVQFKGKLARNGTASGTWENPFFNLKGTWEATRIASK